ncbi:hypothetical protein KCU99_g4392, partial [Aureobasidium melanogenum]
MASTADVPLLITSDNARSERRISPAWTIAQLKSRLEPITGIPASSQRLTLKVASWPDQNLQGVNEDNIQLGAFTLQSYAELHVTDTRPAGLRANYTDVSAVEKYEMPPDEYESRTDSVLHWKKTHQLGRFDPDAPSIEQQKIASIEREIEERGIKLDVRCRLLAANQSESSLERRGTVKYIGPVPEIPGIGAWVGIALDEPTGKNDGTVKGTRYFQCGANCGVIVRPERVEVGDFDVIDEFGSDEEF